MIVQYGGYQHDDSECNISIARGFEYNELGGKTAMIETWTVRGYKQADTQADLTVALNAMEAAYANNGLSMALLTSGGVATTHFLNAEQALYVHAKKPYYPTGTAAEYTTYRQFEIEVEAKFILNGGDGPGTTSDLVSYEESIEVSGTGGPISELARVVSGPWPKIMTATNSPMIIVQKGSAIGGWGSPTVNPPIDPGAILNPIADVKTSLGSPRILFPKRRNFPASWNYVMTYPNAVTPPLPTVPS